VELLREAMTTGRLTVDELDERTRLVFRAKARAELERLVNDVLVPTDSRHPIASGTAGVLAGGGRLPGASGGDGTRRIRSILGGSERKGRWRLAASCSVVNVLGGSKLDLSEAELAADSVDLKIVSVLAGAEIILPTGLNVEISESAILGGNEVDIGDERPDPGGPVVRLRLVSILSGARVSRGPQLTRDQRQELERRRAS